MGGTRKRRGRGWHWGSGWRGPVYADWWKRLSPFRLVLLVMLPFMLGSIYEVAELLLSGMFVWNGLITIGYESLIIWLFLAIWWPMVPPARMPMVLRLCLLGTLAQGLLILPAALGNLPLPSDVVDWLATVLWVVQAFSGTGVALGVAWLSTARGGTEAGDRMPCPQCGYDLQGQTACRCPECGATFTLGEISEVKE